MAVTATTQFESSDQVGNRGPGAVDATRCHSRVQIDEFRGDHGGPAWLGPSANQDAANTSNQFAIDFAEQGRSKTSGRPLGNEVVEGRTGLAVSGSGDQSPEQSRYDEDGKGAVMH